MSELAGSFFDVGNTLVSEEAATEYRIRRLIGLLAGFGRGYSIEDVRSAFREAAEEFAPRLVSGAVERLTDDPECRKSIEAEVRYAEELDAPYSDAEQTPRMLLSRYKIGVIANQSAGPVERLR